MKLTTFLAVLVLAAGLCAADAPPPAKAAPGISSLATLPPSPLTTKLKQVRTTLDEVFKVRDPSSPLPDLRQNPFQIPGVPASTAQAQSGNAGGRAGPQAPETEAARLARIASSLSFGFVEKNGLAPMITMGSSSYKEGEVYRATDPATNAQYLLRIKKIAGKSVTFGLGNSEFTVTK
ncbi:MAG: hypothetical protein RL324_2424 [Verrucomicrobiota bacterium]|jgi:hypothetical protein